MHLNDSDLQGHQSSCISMTKFSNEIIVTKTYQCWNRIWLEPNWVIQQSTEIIIFP